MNFFRQQYLKKGSSSIDSNITSSSVPYATRPTISRGQTYDADTRDQVEEEFIIPELSKEPTKLGNNNNSYAYCTIDDSILLYDVYRTI